jgi:hypothetical protein
MRSTVMRLLARARGTAREYVACTASPARGWSGRIADTSRNTSDLIVRQIEAGIPGLEQDTYDLL